MTIAYIDPGAGSLLLQMVIAGALGAVAFFRSSIAALFRGGKSKGEAEPGEPANADPVETPVSDEKQG